MPKDGKPKGPVIAPITLRVENSKEDKFYYVTLNVRFRDKKQFRIMEDESFDVISHLFNSCFPSDYSLDDVPMTEEGFEQDDGKTKFNLDLLETEIYKGTKKTNPNYYDIEVHGHKVIQITEDEMLKNRRLCPL